MSVFMNANLTMKRHVAVILSASFFAVCFTACSQPSAEVHSASVSTHEHDVTKPSGPGGYQKPGAPVRLINPLPIVRDNLDAFEHRAQFSISETTGQMTVSLSHSEGLTVALSQTSEMSKVFDLSVSGAKEVPVEIQPISYGKNYISFNIEQGQSRRVISQVINIVDPNIPVEVNDIQELEKTQSSGGVVRMKAKETISQ